MGRPIVMFKYLKALALSALVVSAGQLFGAIDTVNGVDWWFKIEGGHAIVQSTMSTQRSAIDPAMAGHVEVPSELGGYPVTAIGPEAFCLCTNLTSVVIPEGVTTIGSSAFYGCSSLESVTLPDGVVSVGESAFYSCGKMGECVLPSSLNDIGDRAFYDCPSLTNVVFSGEIKSVGGSAFGYCGKLADVNFPRAVENLGSLAFSNCSSLTNVCFAANVGSVGSSAFSGCSALKDVRFEAKVGSVEASAFLRCEALADVRFVGDVGSIGETAFSGCSALRDVRFEAKVGSVEASAFLGCEALADVRFAGDVGSVGETAFYSCSALTNVTFGAALTNIQDYAFGNCESLPGVVLPSSVTNIAEGAFYNCRAFTAFEFPASVKAVSDAVLAGCANLVEIVIPEGVTLIGNGAFLNCSKLADVNLPKGILTIEKRAFEGTAFWQTQPDDSVVMLDNYLVGIKGECPSKVVISNGVETISANMFRDCTNLVEVVLPESVKVIGAYAFYNTGLRVVAFPTGLSDVGERAFAECRSLSGISNVSGFRCGEGVFEHTGLPTHDVCFDANKGSLSSGETNKSFVVGVPYGPMPTPTRSAYNYRFAGWYTSAKGGALVTETDIVSDSLAKLYAHWETDDPFSYYVLFYKDSAATSYSVSQTLTNGVSAILRKNELTKAGYVFAGWATEKNGPVVYANQTTVVNLTSEANESISLYACWRDNVYDVSGTGKDCGEVSFPVRWTARLDSETAQTGDKMQTISFKARTSGNASLIARGLEGSSCPTVELWKKAASTSEWAKVCSVYASAASCDFVKGAEYQLRASDAYLQEGCRVYSVCIGECVDVYFDPNGGSLAESSRTRPFIVGLPYEVFPNPTRTEADFEGWFAKSGTQVFETSTVQRGVTNLVARWSLHHSYNVSFFANGGDGSMQSASFRYGEPSSLPANAFVRNFYRFEGWAETADGPVKYADMAVVSDLVEEPGGIKSLYAVWTRIRETRSYQMPSGALTNDIGLVSVVTNALLFTGTLTATSNSHTLVFKTLDSEKKCRLAVDPLSGVRRSAALDYESVTVTDLYHTSISVDLGRDKPVCLVVRCDLQGAETYDYQVSVNALGTQVVYDLAGGVFEGEAASRGTNFNFTVGTVLGYLPEPTNREDEVYFVGWFDAASNRCETADVVPLHGSVLTAKWTDPPPYEYTIRFDGNGATGLMPDLTCSSDVEFSLPSNAFVRTGCSFKGWALSQNGAVEYGDSATISRPLVKKKRDGGTQVTLYARWSGEGGVEIDCVDGIYWCYRISGGGAEVGNMRDGKPVAAIDVATAGTVTVPTELGGVTVISIGTSAFSGCDNLTTVILPNELTSIGDYAFENCSNLTRVKFMGPQPSAKPNIYAGTSKDLVSKVRLVHRESWALDTGLLPSLWPVPEEFADHWYSRPVSWWTDAPKDDDAADMISFYYYDTTGTVRRMSPEEGLSEMPDREGYDFVGWFTKPYGGVQVESADDCAALGVTAVYAHWVQNRGDHDDPQSWDDVLYNVKKAWTYDGYLLDGGAVVGTIQVKMAKGKYVKGDDQYNVSVTAKVLLLGEGKTVSFKGVAEGVDEDGGSADLVCTKKSDEREMSIKFSANGLEGDFDVYTIVGVRNLFAKSTDWDRRAALAAVDDCGVSHVVVLKADGDAPLSNGYAALTVKVSSNGKTKVSGLLPDGTKVSVTSQLLVFEEGYVVPVVAPLYSGKKGGLGFGVLFTRDAESGVSDVSVIGASEWTANPGKANEFVASLESVGVGKPGNLASAATFSLSGASFDLEGASVEDWLLPDGVLVTPSGSKWNLPKADKVKFLRDEESYEVTTEYDNPAGLKLTYTAKTGIFKGSFKVYAVTDAGKSKKYTATVSGAVLNGVGYGTAVIKKVGSVPVIIEPEGL